MNLDIIDTINDPGTPGKGGDDRFGFDASGGRAWALDGATDVTDLKPFPKAESGAAWIAEALSARLMQGPQPGQATQAYFAGVLADVRKVAEKTSKLPLGSVPGEALPIASGIWMRLDGRDAEFAHMGDCMAIVRSGNAARVIGEEGKVNDESDAARAMLAMSAADRMERLRAERRWSNERGSCFSLGPKGAQNLVVQRTRLTGGDEICLMSDGLFRLVSPYATHTPLAFMQSLAADGLLATVQKLRRFEDDASNDLPRLKRRDDASGIYLRITG